MTMQAMRAEFIKNILTNAKTHIEAALAGELDITAGNEDNDVFYDCQRRRWRVDR